MKGAAALCLLALLAAATISDAALTQHDGTYAPHDFFNVRQWFSCFLHAAVSAVRKSQLSALIMPVMHFAD